MGDETVANSGAPEFFILFGVPFVLIGIYLTVGRFWERSGPREHQVYGLTNRRAIIISGMFSRTTNSVLLRNPDVSISARSNGEGTIMLRSPDPVYGRWQEPRRSTIYPSFELIPDANRVYELISESPPGGR